MNALLDSLDQPQRTIPAPVELNERRKPKIARLEHIDGLRGVAATLVICYHYFSRWMPPKWPVTLYPYGDALYHFPIFYHAEYALMTLFVISGFVVTLTLERCNTAFEFAVRRFSRMWPALTLCCCATYAVMSLLPNCPWDVSALNFIPSLTTIDPHIFNRLFRTDRFAYMDGAYWTLWVEIRFYVVIAALYFGIGPGYRRTLFYGSAALIVAYSLANFFEYSNGVNLLNHLFFARQAPWFLIGIGYYYVWKDKSVWYQQPVLLLGVAGLVLQESAIGAVDRALMAVIVALLFHAAMTVPVIMRALSSRILTSIGAASFCMYLLHQNIGVGTMYWLGSVLQLPVVVWVGVAVAMGTTVTLVSMKLYDTYEQPLNQYLATLILERTGRGRGVTLRRTWARLRA